MTEFDTHLDTPAAVDREALARAATTLLIGTAIIVIDLRVNELDLVSDVIGFVAVWLGLTRVREATGPSAWMSASVLLAVGCLVLSIPIELTGDGGVLEQGLYLVQTVGVLALAVHLRDVLRPAMPTVADAWHRVVVASCVEAPLLVLSILVAGAGSDPAELGVGLLLLLAVTVVSGVLLLVALLATRGLARAIGP